MSQAKNLTAITVLSLVTIEAVEVGVRFMLANEKSEAIVKEIFRNRFISNDDCEDSD